MRILHTSDLHLGRQFSGISLEEDHQVVLDQIIDHIKAQAVDILIIAGDVFDRAAPPQSAVRQFNHFLRRIGSETSAAVAMIAGNHDSGDRIDLSAITADTSRWLIRGAVSRSEAPLILSDTYGPVAFSALPFAYEHAARECFDNQTIDTPEDVLIAQIAAARAQVPGGARWVIIAHAFVTGGMVSQSERSLTRVGGIETVSASVFAGAHYVALGHLHRAQSVGADHIRYSGSPLAFGFDEAGGSKSMLLVEIGPAGEAEIQSLPLTPLRQARELCGRHAELIRMEGSNDFVRAVLTDETPVIDAMKRLREVFPNACELVYQRNRRPAWQPAGGLNASPTTQPPEIIRDFLSLVSGEAPSDREEEVILSALASLHETQDAR